MDKCTDVVLLEHLNSEDDILQVTINDAMEYLMIAKYADTLQYIGCDVIITCRQDMYKGQLNTFINTLTIPTRIATLDREEGFKLFTHQTDNFADICFADMQEGETKLNAIMYCVDHTYESSNKAVWASLTVRDKAFKVTKLRLFDYDYNKYNFSGRYIRADVRKSKYGLQTNIVTPLELNVTINPEIEIARKFILSTFADDKEILNIISKLNLLDHMAEVIDHETGYSLVRTAMELSIANELFNITDDVDVNCIKRVLLLKNLYTINPTSSYSIQFRNMATLSGLDITDRMKLMLCIDTLSETDLKERLIIEDIETTVDHIIKIRKGFM